MTLALHLKCKEQLIKLITQGLTQLVAKNSMFLDRLPYFIGIYQAEEALPKNGKLREQMNEYVDEHPLMDFIEGTLSAELRDLDQYTTEPSSVKLTELEKYSDPAATAERLVNEFTTLPWNYKLNLILPKKISDLFGLVIKNVVLGPYLHIVFPSSKFSTEFPLSVENQNKSKRIHNKTLLSLSDKDPEWQNDRAVLQIEAHGFVDLYGTTLPAHKSVELLRSVMGLFIALRLFEIKNSYSSHPHKISFYVHKLTKKKWELDGRFDLEDRYSKVMNDMEVYEGLQKLEHSKQVTWINTVINEAKVVFFKSSKIGKNYLSFTMAFRQLCWI